MRLSSLWAVRIMERSTASKPMAWPHLLSSSTRTPPGFRFADSRGGPVDRSECFVTCGGFELKVCRSHPCHYRLINHKFIFTHFESGFVQGNAHCIVSQHQETTRLPSDWPLHCAQRITERIFHHTGEQIDHLSCLNNLSFYLYRE